MPRMTDAELAALLEAEVTDAESYDRAQFSDDRQTALEYYNGEMTDVPSEEGRSSVVSHDTSDTIGWILPGLMRVFFAGDRIVSYEPQTPADEAAAEQATDYVNHVFVKECNGYRVMWDVFHDALLQRNGIVKHYWDTTPEVTIHILRGLSDDQMIEVLDDEEVEVIEHTSYQVPAPAMPPAPLPPVVPPPPPPPMQGQPGQPPQMSAQGQPQGMPGMDQGGMPVPAPQQPQAGQGAMPMGMDPSGMGFAPEPQFVTYHDLKIRRTCKYGKLVVEAVPPEEFLISRDAKSIEDARFVCHRVMMTRSQLIQAGYDREIVEALPTYSLTESSGLYETRHDESMPGQISVDKSMEEIEVYEAYLKADQDGDGVAETLKVVAAGLGERQILEWEVWDDDTPFSDLTPERVPHRWEGRSVFDAVRDIQKIKTVLTRQMLDNLYLQNHPQREVLESAIINPDEVMNPTLGGVIRTKQVGAVREVAIPFTGANALQAIEWLDGVMEKRTGVSRTSMALDPNALTNQTAAAVNAQMSAAHSKTELIARNMAEMGIARMFRCILRIIVKNQDRPRVIRLRDEWVEMDPRGWNAMMDVTVNIGLGTGSRDRDMAHLQMVLQQQMMVIQMFGMGNPLAMEMIPLVRNTLAKIVETAGLKAPEQYFPEVGPEEIAKLQQFMQSQGQNDPKAQEMQARLQMEQQKMQIEQQKAQFQLQADQQKAQMQAQAAAEKAQIEQQQAMARIEAEMAVARERDAMSVQLKREQLAAEMALKRDQLMAELQLKRELAVIGAQADMAVATSPVQLGGDPG